MTLPRLFLPAVFVLLFQVVAAQSFAPPRETYGVDREAGLILVRAEADELEGVTELLLLGRSYRFAGAPGTLGYDRPYPVTDGTDTYELHFTRLPLLQVNSEAEIRDEPKVPALVRYADAEQELTATAGVEYRGFFSQRFPKKTLDLEFDEDVSFGRMRSDDDWVVDALYNEPMRVNAYISHRLWIEQHELAYADRESRARSGPDVQLTELFLNGRYYGITMLGEQIDRKLLRLKKIEDDGRVRGELFKGSDYKAGTNFTFTDERPVPGAEVWSGHEAKYPKPDEGGSWDDLYAFHRFVTEASDAEFRAGIAGRLDLDNAIDVLLYLNFTGAADNTARNLYLARYDADDPYFYIPWDLDGTLGNSPTGTNGSRTDVWYGNGLYRRLLALNPAEFNQRLCRRYQELRRTGFYSVDRTMARFDEAMGLLERNNVYFREDKTWPGATRAGAKQRDYTRDWVVRRLAFLDAYVCDLAERDPPPPVSTTFTLHPNPATDVINVRQRQGEVIQFYQVYDLTGRLHQKGLIGLDFTIDVGDLPAGNYLVRVGDHGQIVVIR